jgi:hypothetical protein
VSKAIAALRDFLEGLVALGARSRSRYDEMLTDASIFTNNTRDAYGKAHQEERQTCLARSFPSRMGCEIENMSTG